MNMFEEVIKVENYVIDLERHIKHLEQWYVDSEHKDVKVNRELLKSVKEELRELVSNCKRQHEEGACDDSFRFCGVCDCIMGEGYVLYGDIYCNDCAHGEHEWVDRVIDNENAYWSSWF